MEFSTSEQRICNPLQDGENHGFSHNSDAEGAVQGAVEPAIDPDLQRVTEKWPTLPAAFRAAILAMIESART